MIQEKKCVLRNLPPVLNEQHGDKQRRDPINSEGGSTSIGAP